MQAWQQVGLRVAFAETRKPNGKGWLKPDDRYNMPTLDSIRVGMDGDC